MKARPTLFISMAVILATTNVSADTEQQETQEEISSDFLEFLAEMEEVTGDGFEKWLETDNENLNE